MEHATPAVLVLIVIFVGPVLYYIYRAKAGRSVFVRRIPGIDAIDDSIGRSVELGRSVSFTSGLSGVSPTLYACLGVLHHIARKTAIFRSKLFVPSSDPESLVLTDACIQSAYRAENRYGSYHPGMLRFLSEEQFAFASGYQGLMHRENVGAAFLFGRFAAESLILAESGQQVGAVQVAATTSAEQVPFFLVTCDYTVIGEELFAAGAYLSKDPVQTGSLRGQDFVKSFILLLVILGIAQATFNSIQGVKQESFIKNTIDTTWSDLTAADEPESQTSTSGEDGGGDA
jgi:hypothetical protein